MMVDLDKVPSPYVLVPLVAILTVISFFTGWLFAYLKKGPSKQQFNDADSDMDVPIVEQ